MPELSIHQATDAAEYHLAGDWRGVFVHKNSASAVMAMLIFIGIYLTRSGAMVVGPLIIVLSAVFLFFAGGKSSTGLCIITLVIVELVVAVRSYLASGAVVFRAVARSQSARRRNRRSARACTHSAD